MKRNIAYMVTEGAQNFLRVLTADGKAHSFELDEKGLSRLSRETAGTLHSTLQRNGWVTRRGARRQ